MKGKFDLAEEAQNDDGTWSLIFDVDDEFQEWFKEWQGLRRWSDKRFQKVFHKALVSALETVEKEQNNDYYIVKVQETPDGEPFIEFPQKLIDQLGWEVGDDVEWDESEICEDWGEHKGFTLSNKSKPFRDADEARKKAISVDME